jgi:hypothetical protein
MDERRPPRFPAASDDRTVVGGRLDNLAPRTGSVLAHTYRLEAPLPGDGMGQAYRARHVELGTAHVIKILPAALSSSPKLVETLVAEVRKLSGVRDGAIVNYEGLLRDEQGLRFLVMEFVDGETLQAIMARRRLEPDEVLRLRDRLARGLGAVHSRGIIHRDVSPQSIILPDGDVSRAKLTNFGIAQSVDPGEATLLGVDVLAKHAYGSPEQFGLFGGRIDSRSDIYSLGLTLAAAAIGFAKPIDMGTSPATMIAARQRVPDLAAVPAELRPVIAPMLEPRPENRPPSMQALVDGALSAAPATGSPSSARWRTIAIAGALAAGVALIVGIAALRFSTPPPSREELTAKLADATTGYQCASLDYALAPDRSARISGHVASQGDLDRLNRDIAAVHGIGPVQIDVRLMGPPQCDVAAMLAPLRGPVPGGAPSLGFTTKTYEPRIGDRLSLDIRGPGFDGYVYVDYFDRGGQVLHLFPNNRDFFNFRPARNHFTIFKPPLKSCWTFNGSLGQELIALIAATKPLFPAARPEIESIGDYVASLSSAIQQLPQGGAAAATLLFKLDEAAPWSSYATACPS